MKLLRAIATFFLVLTLVAEAVGLSVLVHLFAVAGDLGTDSLAERMAYTLAVNLYTTGIALVALLAGVGLHYWIAKRTEKYSRSIWILLLIVAISLCVTQGILLGVILLVLLFNVEIFKRMKENRTKDFT